MDATMSIKSVNRIFFTLLITWIVSGCGGSGGSADGTVAKVVITSGSQLLTGLGETRSLTAQAYNAAGEPVNADITWRASQPDNISVDAYTGDVTANALGSSLVTARAGGVDSPPVMMVYTTPVIGAILVSDAQIVSKPRLVDPGAVFDIGTQFTVTLTGITPPQPGDILMGRQSIPLAGRVVSTTTTGNNIVVTMEITPVNEIFDDLVIKETFDLSQLETRITPAAASYYSMTEQADGTLVFDLLPGAVNATTGAFVPPSARTSASAFQAQARANVGGVSGTRANPFHPFDCVSSTPELRNILSITPGTGANSGIVIKQNIGLIYEYNQHQGGLQKLGLGGDLGVEFSNKFTIAVQFESKITCKLELFQKNLPLPGPIGFLLGTQIPFGLGGKIGGKVTIADTGYELKVTLAAHVESALVCESGACGSFNGGIRRQTNPATGKEIDYITWDAKINLLGSDASDLRFEPNLTGFGYMEIKFGNPLFANLQLSMVEARLGPTQQASLALVDAQIANTIYKSDYKLTNDLKISLGSDIAKIMKIFGALPFSTPSFTLGADLATSPASLAVTSDVEHFTAGDTVAFQVQLDPASVNYLGIYNVDEVIIYHRTTSDNLERVATEIATDNQTDFTLAWTADSAGSTGEFYAFVKTRLSLLPDALAELELGKVVGQQTGAGKITFLSDRDGNQEIYVMNPDGSNPINLTNNQGYDQSAIWSPDGSKVIYTSDFIFYTMNADGSNQVSLMKDSNELYRPAWSPDGSKIAFDNGNDIFIMNADGSNPVNLTNTPLFTKKERGAAWSPDGSTIAFYSDRDGSFEIYTMSADGSNQIKRTNTPGIIVADPVWSPDGLKIAYVGRPELSADKRDIYVVNADGSTPVRLTNSPTIDKSRHAWSPNGLKIAFEGDGDIYVMHADGSNQAKLTNAPDNSVSNRNPAWSPDSSKIAFASNRNGDYDIYVINTDGSNPVDLTQNNAGDYRPVWLP